MNEREKDIASALPAELDALPRLDGFRLRGMQLTRLATLKEILAGKFALIRPVMTSLDGL